MSEPIKDIRSLLHITNAEVDRAETQFNISHAQIVYLSDKLEKVFHNLRQFNSEHGRDFHPEVLDAFNAAWRSQEASFDVWKSYNKDNTSIQHSQLNEEINDL